MSEQFNERIFAKESVKLERRGQLLVVHGANEYPAGCISSCGGMAVATVVIGRDQALNQP